jgi:hypothetical protein
MEKHIVVIIDNKKVIEPKLYSCELKTKTKKEAVDSAKKTYENKYKNFDYESYHFIN